MSTRLRALLSQHCKTLHGHSECKDEGVRERRTDSGFVNVEKKNVLR